jgi:hypothetical protein
VFQAIFAEHGIGGFYRGASAFAVLCLRPAIQYVCFERLKAALLLGPRHQAANRAHAANRGGGNGASEAKARLQLSAAEAFLCGALARCVATCLIYPYVRAKVLAMTAARDLAKGAASATSSRGAGAAPAASVSGALRAVVGAEGVRGLYVGLGPELVRGMLSSAVMLMVKEQAEAETRKGIAALAALTAVARGPE